jgi:hypothetical protein
LNQTIENISSPQLRGKRDSEEPRREGDESAKTQLKRRGSEKVLSRSSHRVNWIGAEEMEMREGVTPYFY